MARTAQDAYLEKHTEALGLLEELQQALFDLPAPDGEVAINWTHVGTVAEARDQIKRTLAFLAES